MSVELQRRLFTVDEYHAMARAGVFGEDDRIELIEGEIVEVAAIGSRHAACVNRLNRLLSDSAGDRAIVSVQNPVRLSDLSEPEPDVVLLRPREDFYEGGHPGPHDILLLVEVAEASLEADRSVKVPLYARAGVPEVWVVDVPGEAVEVFRTPVAESHEGKAGSADSGQADSGYADSERVDSADSPYAESGRLGPDGVLRPEGLPGVEIPGREVLGMERT